MRSRRNGPPSCKHPDALRTTWASNSTWVCWVGALVRLRAVVPSPSRHLGVADFLGVTDRGIFTFEIDGAFCEGAGEGVFNHWMQERASLSPRLLTEMVP